MLGYGVSADATQSVVLENINNGLADLGYNLQVDGDIVELKRENESIVYLIAMNGHTRIEGYEQNELIWPPPPESRQFPFAKLSEEMWLISATPFVDHNVFKSNDTLELPLIRPPDIYLQRVCQFYKRNPGMVGSWEKHYLPGAYETIIKEIENC